MRYDDTQGDLKERAQRLIGDALAVRSWCDDRIKKCLADANIDRWVDLLRENDLYKTFCGDFHVGSQDLPLFWSCVQAIIFDQLGGFLIDERGHLSTIAKIVGDYEAFWKDVDPQSTTARKYALLSLYRAFRGFPSTENPADQGLGSATNGPSRPAREQLSPIEKGIKEQINSSTYKNLLLSHRDAIRENDLSARLLRAHHSELVALLQSTELARSKKDLSSNREQLFAWLAKLLTRGNNSATAFEIALLARIIGGRSLNANPPNEPNWKLTFREAIDYVLEKQVKNDGRWIEPEIDRVKEDPLYHSYTPLIYLLDLRTDILTPHFDRLITAAKDVIERLWSEIDETRREFSNIDDEFVEVKKQGGKSEKNQGRDLIYKLAVWLSVSTVVADRFKDLLSTSVLEDLGAVLPETEIQWEQIPDALRFQENIKHGVIDKWEQRNPRRPGAILVYGPPGTGKTTIAKVLAKELDRSRWSKQSDFHWYFLELSPTDFARDGMDKIVANAEYLFSQLRHVRRCVVLLDEMEEFLRIRDDAASRESRLITTAFLPLLTEVVQSREIILVVATNFVGSIDPAVTRRGRFDLILPLGPPDDSSRRKLVRLFDSFHYIKQRLGGSEADVAALLSYYMMGYTLPEMRDFMIELYSQCEKGPVLNLAVVLWSIRSERVPTALSGRVGCSWRTFADEAKRYGRYYAEAPQEAEMTAYWREPRLPNEGERQQGLSVEELVRLLPRGTLQRG